MMDQKCKAVLRRTTSGAAPVNEVKEVSYDKLVVNMTRYELKVDGKVVDTPPKELELLFHLASNPNRVYTRDQLLDEVWGFEYYGDSLTVDVHIKRLREKLEGVSDQWCLKTVWGVGYKFEVKEYHSARCGGRLRSFGAVSGGSRLPPVCKTDPF